ncbi:uncharacterized protein LOC142317461 [Lycorma delicatula]|uniref:uncharacterized protein LOC142317461 n=1 Tax=Lycorma delicatula TaxID=130591 RepID=UPI003F51A326
MDVPVKNIYVYEAFPSNSIKLETEDDTTKETLLLILPHHPIEDDITPVCESESLQVKEEPINNGCDNIDEVTDPLVSEGTNLIKLEDHKIKHEAESEILLNDVSPLVNLNMKSNELRIKDFHTVKTKDGMVFYPCRFVQAVKHMYMIETPLTKACTEWFLWDPHLDGLQSHWSQLVCTSYAYSTDY